jgi:histidyl-tRNA synthetase
MAGTMKSTIQSVKGTRDFYPAEMSVRTWLYQIIREVSESFGYQEYDGPFLEKIDLYAAKSGEELVKEQAFVFPDRGGDLITLRPELTPSLARMVAARQNELVFPLHWWSFGPFWRYERPQKGRTREFFQWNIDLIGANSTESDAELLAVAARFFQKVGMSAEKVKIVVNNRRLMDAEFVRLGITPEQKESVFRLIDRRDKMSAEAWETYAGEAGLNPEQFQGIRQILSDKDLWKKSPELVTLFSILAGMGLKEYFQFDPSIIRGLLYYTGTVFEAKDQGEGGRSILGGGRYDNLVADVGGEALSGIGFAMGDVMISLLLQGYGLIPELPTTQAKTLVTVFDDAHLAASHVLADELRQAGILVITYPDAVKLPKQLKYADRLGIRYVLICGPDEDAAGKVTFKDLKERTQETVDKKEAAQILKQWLVKA